MKVPIPLSSSVTCVRDDDKGIDTTPFPTAQGSSSVTDASADDVILNDKKRKLLDVQEDNDEVEDDNHKDEVEDDGHEKEEATTITTPSKSEVVVVRTSSRVVQLDRAKKVFALPNLLFLSMKHFLYLVMFCLFLYSLQVSNVEIP